MKFLKKKKPSNKILIVGGTGFIGHNLAIYCKKKKWNVTCIHRKKLKKNILKSVEYIKVDIKNYNHLNNKLKNRNFDYIVNCAGYIEHSNKKSIELNHYLGLKNLSKIFLKKKIKSFLQIGSAIEYGKKKSPHIEENFIKLLKIKSLYGISKLKSSKFLLELSNNENFKCNIIRVYLSYGPFQKENRIIPQITRACLFNKKFNCTSGKQIRSFIYIDDLIKLIVKVIKKNKFGHIYNAGGIEKIRVKDLIKKIVSLCKGGKPIFNQLKMRNYEQNKIFPSLKKTKKEFNWLPKINIDNGLKKTVSFYKKS